MIQSEENNLPEGWALVRASDVCEVNPRKHAADALPADALVTFAPMAAVDEDLGAITAPEDRPFGELRPKSYTPFAEGDVLLAKITPCMENGKAAVARGLTNGLGFGTTEFHVFRSTGAVVPEYLYHYIRQQSFRDDARAHMSGAVGQLRVPADYVKQFKLPLPPLAEQERIVAKVEALLARVRSVRQRLDAVPGILKHFRQAVLAHACSGKLTEDWRDEHQSCEDGQAVLDRISKLRGSNPPDVAVQRPRESPDTWAWTTFGHVIGELRNGISIRPAMNPPGIPILRISATRPGRVLLDDRRYLPDADDLADTYSLRDTDLLFTRYNGSIELLGVCGMVRGIGNETVLYPDKLMRVRFDHEDVVPAFAEVFFQGPDARERLVGEAKSSAGQQGVSGRNIKAQAFAIPPVEEQHEIIRRVEALLSLADSIEQRVAAAMKRAEALAQSILARAFRGELVPTEADLAEADPRIAATYETAEQLLARIREESPATAGAKRKRKQRRTRAEKQAVERGEAILAILLLLDAWKRPVHRRWLDAGVILVLNADVRAALLNKSSPKRPGRRAASEVRYQPALDVILKNLTDADAVTITLTGERQAIGLSAGFNSAQLNRATDDDRAAAREAIEVLEKLNERDAMSILQEMSRDVELELVS